MPRLLDLFCGAGGAAEGYYRAGFTEIVGVDLAPQPRYPFGFVQQDAIEYVRLLGHTFDAIHASPPCQPFSRGQKVRKGVPSRKPDLIVPTRDAIEATGRPWVIENVPGAPLFPSVVLCGSSFGLRVRRHRVFETNVVTDPAPPCRHREQGRPVGVYYRMRHQVTGTDSRDGRYVRGGKTADSIEEAREAMGIDWMTWDEIKEAIPPAYTEWLGRFLLDAI